MSIGVSLFGMFSGASAAEDAAALRAAEQERQAKFNYAKLSIAQSISDRANQIHGIWTGYYLPVETQTVQEICAQPVESPHLAVQRKRAMAEVIKASARRLKAELYCIAPQQTGVRQEAAVSVAIMQAELVTATALASTRVELARVRAKNMQRLNDRINIANGGRQHNVSTTDTMLMAARQYDKLSKEAEANSNLASQMLGRSVGLAITSGRDFLKTTNMMPNQMSGQDPIQRDTGILGFFGFGAGGKQAGNTIVNIDNSKTEENLGDVNGVY